VLWRACGPRGPFSCHSGSSCARVCVCVRVRVHVRARMHVVCACVRVSTLRHVFLQQRTFMHVSFLSLWGTGGVSSLQRMCIGLITSKAGAVHAASWGGAPCGDVAMRRCDDAVMR